MAYKKQQRKLEQDIAAVLARAAAELAVAAARAAGADLY